MPKLLGENATLLGWVTPQPTDTGLPLSFQGGITLPGMPEGTPGMPGKKTGPLTIYEIGKAPPKVYATV